MKRFTFFLTLMLVASVFGSVPDSGNSNKNVLPMSYFIGNNTEASTVRVLSTGDGTNITMTNPYTNSSVTYFAGVFNATLDGNPTKLFCIDLRHSLAYYSGSQPHEYTDSGNTPSQITYILNNSYPFKSYPYPGAASTVQKEAAAIQAAIWFFSDGVNPNTITNTDVKNRANALISAANANNNSVLPVTTLLITPSSQSLVNGSVASFTVAAFDTNGAPLAGRTIQLSTTAGTLSATSVVTGVNGISPLITLTQGSGNSAVVTALANVIIPQGTRYFHKVSPNDYQKLVLATPGAANKSVTASVSWYNQPSTCDLNGFVTYTQGGWGSKDNSGPGSIRAANFASVFPSGLTIGSGSNKATFTSSTAIKNYLPAGGTASALTGNLTNPTSTSAGVLGGQITALTINVYFDSAGVIGPNPQKLGNLVFSSGTFAGMTVYQFLAIANQALGGASTGYTFSQINDAATKINENFDNGSSNNGDLTCAPTVVPAKIGDRVWFDTDKDGKQDANENGVSGVTVRLYDCNNVLKGTTTTNATGYYFFNNLVPGDYYVEFVLPSGHVFTLKDQGVDDTKDSDADVVTGKTACTNLSNGEEDLSWDAGIHYAPDVCVTNWVGTIGSDSAMCLYNAQPVSIVAGVSLTPNPGRAKLQTSWKIVSPTDLDTSTNYFTKDIFGDTSFVLTANWPGIRSSDTQVRIRYTVNVLDCNGNNLHAAVSRDLYWNTTVCPPPAPAQADIRVVKTANKDSVLNGENITFTVAVTNLGPQAATNIVVKDLLPAGVTYVTHSTSAGTYNQNSGIWNIASLANGATVTLTLTAKADLLGGGSAVNLGAATGFNLFVLNDLNMPSSDTEGKAAIGRNASLGGYSVGDKLPMTAFGTEDVLIVGNNLTYTSGAVYNGNIVYGNSSNLPIYAVSTTGGTVRKDSVINFPAASAYLNTLSAQLANYPVNGNNTVQFGGLFLQGDDPVFNVFSVNSSILKTINDLQIHVPNGAVAVVNVIGDSTSWMGGFELFGTTKENVLFNFYNVPFLRLSGIDVTGTILAPTTTVHFVAGVQNGQMICYNMYGQGQMNNSSFLGNIPVDSSLVNIAQVLSSSPTDPNMANNTSSKTFNIYGVQQTGGSGGSGASQWQLVSSVSINQMVLTLANLSNGSILAGTQGGNIYQSTNNGQTWAVINSGMAVTYVWSLEVAPNGHIYAGTERGLFRSTNNGVSWAITELAGKDVRSVNILPNGDILAGTWGFGVYKSVDNGQTFNVSNNGLTTMAVHALERNSAGVFAGTFGGGIFFSADGGNSWLQQQIEYEHIWSLGVTSNGTIFAGTYGRGLFYSTNNGANWLPGLGIPSSFIYAISVDNADNIYVSTWAGGVYAAQGGSFGPEAPGAGSTVMSGFTWSPIGMQGYAVSSLLANLQTGALYLGTNQGQFFKNETPLGVKPVTSSDVPVEFSLEQNYPNPFNPETNIRFALPKKENVTLIVYNILGQQVRTILAGELEAGVYNFSFQAENLASGVYIYSLRAGSVTMTKKMILQK